MSNERKETVILGTLVHTPVRGELEVIHDALVSVSANGEIVKSTKTGQQPTNNRSSQRAKTRN